MANARDELDDDQAEPESGAEAEALRCIATATVADLPRIVEIDQLTFSDPWTEDEYRRELARDHARLEIVRLTADGPVAAFIDYWVAADEVQLMKVATHPDFVRQGLARQLVLGLIASAAAAGASVVTLEVRCSNLAAITLYLALGFIEVGVRPRYYKDGEDALLMDLNLASSGDDDPLDEEDPDA